MTNIYISYFPKDKDYLENLLVHLKVLRKVMQDVKVWTDKKVLGGDETTQVKQKAFKKADIILLMISSHYLACDESCSDEMEKSLACADKGEKIVIPVLVRSSLWKYSDLAKLVTLPGNHVPVNSKVWNNEDEPYLEIVEGIRHIILELRGDLTEVNETEEKDLAPKRFISLGKWMHSLQIAAIAAITVLSFSMIFTNASHPNDPKILKGNIETPSLEKVYPADTLLVKLNGHDYQPGFVWVNAGGAFTMDSLDSGLFKINLEQLTGSSSTKPSMANYFAVLGSGNIKSLNTSNPMHTFECADHSGSFSTYPRKQFPLADTETPKSPNSPWRLPDAYNNFGILLEPIGDIEEADSDLV